jgi:2OG-Fe(II) oxygenase superfamily
MLLEAPALTLDAVRTLINGEALILRVPNYLPDDICTVLTQRTMQIATDPGKQKRIYESNVKAFTDADVDPEIRSQYLASSVTALASIRRLCEPYLSPSDRLRCELDELWPAGASLLRVENMPLVFGMIRLWRDGAGALPHIDVLQRSSPWVVEARLFTMQLGVNVYLVTPHEGNGEIELWNLSLHDLNMDQHQVQGTYGFRYELLPQADLVVQPKQGDLVVLCSNRLHAVRPTTQGTRVSMSGFIGLRDETEPLRLWS